MTDCPITTTGTPPRPSVSIDNYRKSISTDAPTADREIDPLIQEEWGSYAESNLGARVRESDKSPRVSGRHRDRAHHWTFTSKTITRLIRLVKWAGMWPCVRAVSSCV